MKNFFLLNLSISGIKNIEKMIEIPFYKKTIKDDFNPEQYRVKGIYGENGSGKTAIMTAVKIMTRILLNRNYLGDSVNQKLLAENINKRTKAAFIEAVFHADFGIGEFIYRYRIHLETRPDGRVYLAGESLEKKNGRYSQNHYLPVFITQDGDLIQFDEGEKYEFCKAKTLNLLEQRSFATFTDEIKAAGYEYGDDIWHHLFTLMIFAARINVGIDGDDDHHQYASSIVQQETGNAVLHEMETSALFSWGIPAGRDKGEIMILQKMMPVFMEKVNKLVSFVRIFKPDLKNIKVDVKEYREFYICRLIMMYDGYELDQEYESRGIKKLMNLFDALDAACRGDIVFIDELDSNINDVYLDKLIEYFIYYGKGQLCFTAHNLSPMSVLKNSKCAISFISGVNTIHTWTSNGNLNPENAYRNGFIEDSPFNVEASDFLGILGGADE